MIPPRYRTPTCIIALLAINIYITHFVFLGQVNVQTGSIEVLLMSFARWLAENWNDRSWMPTWIMGNPVRQVYNPALHATVAAFIKLTGWNAPQSYHFVTTSIY